MGFVRNKVVALLLGTSGLGIIGIYQSVIDMVRAFSGLGLDMGAIRDVAQANSKEQEEVDRTVSVFKRWFFFTAVLGAAICVIFCISLSKWAFDDDKHALPIALLSISVFLIAITAGKSVVLQGLRQIPFMAKASVCESVFGIFIIVPVYYFLGIDGVIPVLLFNALLVYCCVSFFYRRLGIKTVKVSVEETIMTGSKTLQLGIFIILGSIVNTSSMFILRAYISRDLGGLDSVGLFQSAWSIMMVYVGLILGSTGSDIYPRLCAVCNDRQEVRKLVNEQTYIILVLAIPIVVGMLLLPDFALWLLYSSKFAGAKVILLWMVIGSFFKVLASPIASIMLAKNKGIMYLLSEVVFFVVFLASAYLLSLTMGIAGIGIGFLIAYITYLIMVFVIGRKISGFGWNRNIMQMIAVAVLLFTATYYTATSLNGYMLIAAGSLLLLISIGYAISKLSKVFDITDLKSWLKKKGKK